MVENISIKIFNGNKAKKIKLFYKKQIQYLERS